MTGKTIGKYRFVEQLGRGATGVVYTVLPAWDPVLRRLFLIEVTAVTVALALIVGFGPKLAGRALKPLGSVSTVAGELRRGRLGSRVNLPELGGFAKLAALGLRVEALCAFEGH